MIRVYVLGAAFILFGWPFYCAGMFSVFACSCFKVGAGAMEAFSKKVSETLDRKE